MLPASEAMYLALIDALTVTLWEVKQGFVPLEEIEEELEKAFWQQLAQFPLDKRPSDEIVEQFLEFFQKRFQIWSQAASFSSDTSH